MQKVELFELTFFELLDMFWIVWFNRIDLICCKFGIWYGYVWDVGIYMYWYLVKVWIAKLLRLVTWLSWNLDRLWNVTLTFYMHTLFHQSTILTLNHILQLELLWKCFLLYPQLFDIYFVPYWYYIAKLRGSAYFEGEHLQFVLIYSPFCRFPKRGRNW